MNEAQRSLLTRSSRALESARLLLKNDDGPAAVNRAYYAAFWAAQAALLEYGETPRTHTGIQNRFYIRLVEPGLLPVSVAKTLGYANTLRQGADYDVSPYFEKEAVADLITDVETLCTAIKNVLPSAKTPI